MSHPLFVLIAALALAVAMAAAENRSARERLRAGVRVFAGCVAAIVAGGWLMRLIHG